MLAILKAKYIKRTNGPVWNKTNKRGSNVLSFLHLSLADFKCSKNKARLTAIPECYKLINEKPCHNHDFSLLQIQTILSTPQDSKITVIKRFSNMEPMKRREHIFFRSQICLFRG